MSALEAWVLLAMAYLAPGRDHRELGAAIAEVVDAERPLFERDADRLKTASLVVAIAFRESTFRQDVTSKTDDWCALQVHRRPELALDARECIRVGLTMLRESMRVCPAHPVAFYSSGPIGCTDARAQRISRDRMWLASKLAREVRP